MCGSLSIFELRPLIANWQPFGCRSIELLDRVRRVSRDDDRLDGATEVRGGAPMCVVLLSIYAVFLPGAFAGCPVNEQSKHRTHVPDGWHSRFEGDVAHQWAAVEGAEGTSHDGRAPAVGADDVAIEGGASSTSAFAG